MYQLISKLVLYRNFGDSCLLTKLADIIKESDKMPESDGGINHTEKEHIISKICSVTNELLNMAVIYGFDGNIWQNYLAYLIVTNENPFSIACEKIGAGDGTLNIFAKSDFKIFRELFHYDFSRMEKKLKINCFSMITNFQAAVKNSSKYNRAVGNRIRMLSDRIASAKDENEIFKIVTDFYRDYGVGKFGLYKAFRISGNNGDPEIIPITDTQEVRLSDLVGYELQKKKLTDNTKAFVEGKKANNVLLYGDSGTGKSTSIKAILNEFCDRGLRMIEIYKHQFKDLNTVISKIKNRNYKFIIYMDDLSFEEFETEYKYLKAVIEGGLENRPDNILIYATSNRRHLIKEIWKDRDDMEYNEDIHRSDTIEEKLSLVERFGITINYSAPSRDEYMEIVKQLAAREGIDYLSEEELAAEAGKWELYNGGLSGRTAQQFVNYLAGRKP